MNISNKSSLSKNSQHNTPLLERGLSSLRKLKAQDPSCAQSDKNKARERVAEILGCRDSSLSFDKLGARYAQLLERAVRHGSVESFTRAIRMVEELEGAMSAGMRVGKSVGPAGAELVGQPITIGERVLQRFEAFGGKKEIYDIVTNLRYGPTGYSACSEPAVGIAGKIYQIFEKPDGTVQTFEIISNTPVGPMEVVYVKNTATKNGRVYQIANVKTKVGRKFVCYDLLANKQIGPKSAADCKTPFAHDGKIYQSFSINKTWRTYEHQSGKFVGPTGVRNLSVPVKAGGRVFQAFDFGSYQEGKYSYHWRCFDLTSGCEVGPAAASLSKVHYTDRNFVVDYRENRGGVFMLFKKSDTDYRCYNVISNKEVGLLNYTNCGFPVTLGNTTYQCCDLEGRRICAEYASGTLVETPSNAEILGDPILAGSHVLLEMKIGDTKRLYSLTSKCWVGPSCYQRLLDGPLSVQGKTFALFEMPPSESHAKNLWQVYDLEQNRVVDVGRSLSTTRGHFLNSLNLKEYDGNCYLECIKSIGDQGVLILNNLNSGSEVQVKYKEKVRYYFDNGGDILVQVDDQKYSKFLKSGESSTTEFERVGAPFVYKNKRYVLGKRAEDSHFRLYRV